MFHHLARRGLRQETLAEMVRFDVFPKGCCYLKLGDHSSELPWRNAILNHFMTKRTLIKHVYEAGVYLCASGAVTPKTNLLEGFGIYGNQ